MFGLKQNLKNSLNTLWVVRFRNYSDKSLKKYYDVLGLSENCDQEELRNAYISLAKKYHPDSNSSEACLDKFLQVENAFKILLNKKSKERYDVEEENNETEENDASMKHTTPQHRQYLSYEGVGSGNPYQREKQYASYRALRASETIRQHRITKSSSTEISVKKHDIKTKYGFDRLVEDLIQEAMSRGEFSNLSGSGRPLPTHNTDNPHVDFITHKLNQVLIDNGFAPEWISLQKDISAQLINLRHDLKYGNESDEELEKRVKQINSMIDRFNLMVPLLQRQRLHISLEKERKKVTRSPQPARSTVNESRTNTTQNQTLFSMLESLFK